MTSGNTGGSFALSIGDLMTALLLVFVLLVSAMVLLIRDDRERIDAVVDEYEALQDSLYMDLMEEFADDLEQWAATIDRQTLSVRFQEPDVLFGAGDASLQPQFEVILDDFFPRYIGVLRRDRYRDSITEIRIEGHTSSEWTGATTAEEAYFNNMRLSQDRTRSVLRYVLGTLERRYQQDWTRGLITANGLSSSQLIYTDDGEEDREASRRVEFRVRTDAETQLSRIVEALSGDRRLDGNSE